MKNVRTRALAVASVIAAAGVLSACGGSVQSFEVGECLDMSDTAQGQLEDEIPVVDCDEPHDGEVFYLHEFDDGDFPGADAIQTETQQACEENILDYVGEDPNLATMGYTAVTPTEETWDQADDRESVCIVMSNPEETGSVQSN